PSWWPMPCAPSTSSPATGRGPSRSFGARAPRSPDLAGALLTDLYELNMAASYLRRGLTGDATFSLYVQTLPPTRGFLVAAGLEACLDFLESSGFDARDLRWLGRVAGAVVRRDATSSVEAGRRWSLVAAGPMAHSYIETFPTELEAFRAFAEDFPDRATFLVDTYDTRGGVRHAIEVIRERGLGDRAAIRLDSGDLGALATEARSMLDAARLPQVRIFASGGLDELRIEDLV